ncbi:MAG: fumarylacetoacetate hydrolase family protein [Phycisphaerales bacterium]|nr:fumarylacetoacetate hydrolase family protein [Phycisphaerales bacterium]
MTHNPPAIFCIGRNYADHAAEMQTDLPDRPTVFMKNPAAACSATDAIVLPPICDEHGPQVDFEGELAVILGTDCRDVAQDDALACVHGYAVANDVSARWWQKQGSGGQWIRGKSFDTFCPLSDPVPASTVDDPQQLTLITRLNGEVMQHSSTSNMIFSVASLIAELSRGTTLLAGTVLLTGTPAGVGWARNPKRLLQDGDVIEVEIPGVGLLTNPVRR